MRVKIKKMQWNLTDLIWQKCKGEKKEKGKVCQEVWEGIFPSSYVFIVPKQGSNLKSTETNGEILLT